METRKQTIETSIQYRALDVKRDAIDAEARTVELAFSSEAPVERYFGIEILDHDPSSIRLGRLNQRGPVLVDHDPTDHVGVVESVSVDADRKARAVVRFGKSARAEEIFNDVVDGIRGNVSVGYRIHRMIEEGTGKQTTMRVMDWEPLEISIVSIPADAEGAGIGRSAEETFDTVIEREVEPTSIEIKETAMSDVSTAAPSADDVRKSELGRIREIESLGNLHGQTEMAREFISNGKSLDAFRAELLKKIETRKVAGPEGAESSIGMSDKEVRSYSLVRAINAMVTRDWSDAGLELEASRAVAEKIGKKAQGIYLPMDVMSRDLTVGTNSAGGYTVGTDMMGGSFIDLLRNRMMVMQMGARLMTGLNGNVAIPRQSGGATAYWVAENGAITESGQTFDQVTMSPKTIGALTDISRRLLLQSSVDVEALVRDDLATTIALALDLAAINGSGSSNQPTGILNTSGIGDVAGGTNGLAPTFAHMVELETDVATANADIGALGYLTNAKVRGKLKQTEKASSTGQFVWDGNGVNGYNAMVSNQVPSTLDKGTSTGVCSAIIFGNWNDLIVGQWGAGIDVMVDPYTGGAAGTVRVRAMQDVDIAVRHAASFSAMQDALTA